MIWQLCLVAIMCNWCALSVKSPSSGKRCPEVPSEDSESVSKIELRRRDCAARLPLFWLIKEVMPPKVFDNSAMLAAPVAALGFRDGDGGGV